MTSGSLPCFFQVERDVQVGHETAFLKALAIVRGGANVSFQVDVGIRGGAHHPRRCHFYRLQIHRPDFQPGTQLGFPDRVFLGVSQWCEQDQGE